MKRKIAPKASPKARKDARPSPSRTPAEDALAAWAQRATVESRHACALAALAECDDPTVKEYRFAQSHPPYVAKVRRARAALADAMRRTGDAQLGLLADAEATIAELVARDPALMKVEQAKRKQRLGAERGAATARQDGAATGQQVVDAFAAWKAAGRNPRGFASAKAAALGMSASQIRRTLNKARTA